MAGHLKKILDFVATESILKKTSLARMSLLVGEDVSRVTEDTPDDPTREEKYIRAAQQILGLEVWNLTL